MAEKEFEDFEKKIEVVGEISDAAIEAIAAFLVDQYCLEKAKDEQKRSEKTAPELALAC